MTLCNFFDFFAIHTPLFAVMARQTLWISYLVEILAVFVYMFEVRYLNLTYFLVSSQPIVSHDAHLRHSENHLQTIFNFPEEDGGWLQKKKLSSSESSIFFLTIK